MTGAADQINTEAIDDIMNLFQDYQFDFNVNGTPTEQEEVKTTDVKVELVGKLSNIREVYVRTNLSELVRLTKY